MAEFAVPQPILNTPFNEPVGLWCIEAGVPPEQCAGRWPSGYFLRDPDAACDAGEYAARGVWQVLPLVNLLRARLQEWRAAAVRWVNAVNADGSNGQWRYALARSIDAVRGILDES